MRHGKTFSKRLLTFVLSIAMVLSSVNVPVLTVQATEATDSENPLGESTNPVLDGENEYNTPGTTEAEENVPSAMEEGGEDERPNPPGSVTVKYEDSGDNAGKISVVWGLTQDEAANQDHYSWQILVDGELVKSVDLATMYYLDNQWEPGEHYVTVITIKDGISSEPSAQYKFTVPSDAEVVDPVDPPSEGAPVKPEGLTAHYWTDDTPNKGDIYIGWRPYS